jgi:hypothetical protein
MSETSVTDRNKLVLFAASFLAMPSQLSARCGRRNGDIASHNNPHVAGITFMNSPHVSQSISMHFDSALANRLKQGKQCRARYVRCIIVGKLAPAWTARKHQASDGLRRSTGHRFNA